jgi:hypothetical protein
LDFETTPDNNKTVERMLLRYESLGAATLNMTMSANSPMNQPAVTQTRTTDVSMDGTLRQLLFDGSMTADILQLLLSRTANSGPLSITLYCPYYDERGEKIEAT